MMLKARRALLSVLLGFAMLLSLCFGVVFAMPTRTAKAADGTFGSGWSYTNATNNGGGYATETLESVDAATVGYSGTGNVLKMSSTTTGGSGVTVHFSQSAYTKSTVESINFKVRYDYTTTPTDSEFRLYDGSAWLFSKAYYVTNYTSGEWYTISFDSTSGYWASFFSADGTMKDLNVCARIKTSAFTWYLGDIVVEEKEETVVDFSESVLISTKAQYGDYGDAYMIRVQFAANGNYWGKNICLNDSYPNLLKYLTINGKSFFDLRAEYATDFANGTAKEITWTGYPSNESVDGRKPMQPNIADDLTRETPRILYAPIFAMLTYHESLSANCIDIYIPGTYLDPSDIETFGISKDFSWTAEDGTRYTVSNDVTFYGLGYGKSYKQIGALNLTETETTVTQIQPNASNTNFLLVYLSENNYDGTSHATGGLQGVEQLAKLKLWNYIEVDGRTLSSIYRSNGISEVYYQVWSKADSFAFRVTSHSSDGTTPISKVRIKAGAQFPKYESSTLISTTECYTVKKEIIFVNNNGVWEEYVEQIETNVTDAKLVFNGETDAFAAIALEGSDYAKAPQTYAGDVVTALSYAQSENFLSHILMDGVPLIKPGEAFLNVWRNYGYFTFRPNNINVSKITILAGCQFPTYDALLNGTSEVYVTTEDVTFVKGGDGTWVEGSLAAGEYETSISSAVYARDNANNWMMLTLTNKDYPNAGTTYNVATKEAQISALNLYDKIIVDGYTLRARIKTNGNPVEAPKINLWVADCFAFRIAGAAGALNGAQKITIRAGAQFPSYAYITEGVAAYYVTTEEVTFVNVGADNGSWERQYNATFVADGAVVETIPYLVSTGFTAPEVPEKDGYKGVWESYTANGDITVNAVYTKKPTSLGSTGIKELRNIDMGNALFVINPTTSDYPADYNLGLDVSHLQKFNILDYITINGKTLRENGVSSMAINKFTRAGLGLETPLSDSMTIVIKEGCEIPSYAFWQNPNGEASCYTIDNDYTAVYSAGGEAAFLITSEAKAPTDFEDNYILSDLFKEGYGKTSVFKDGIETLVRTDGSEADYHYGHIDSKSFTLSFDFKYTEAAWYESFAIMFGTDGYNGVKACFGWRFFLLRGSDTDGISNSQCVQFFSGCDKGADGKGNIEAVAVNGTYFVAGQTYHVIIGYQLVDADTVLTYASVDGNVLAKKSYDLTNTHDTYGNFSSYSSNMDTIAFCKEQTGGAVTVSDPYVDMTTAKNTLVLNDGSAKPQEIVADSYVLPALNPAEYNKGGNVFVGWTTNTSTYPDLYPAGYELSLEAGAVTLYPVWINFTTQNGAAVRKTAPSGLRFLVDIDKPYYEAGYQLGYFTELGTILCPTSYLTNRELTHDLGAGYFVEAKTTEWNDDNTYSAAFVNLSAEQYARSFSARGYIKVQYKIGNESIGEGYIYAAYDANEHARSMYEVANAAKKAGENIATDVDYINTVADITVTADLIASKNANTVGVYTVNSTVNENQLTVTVSGAVKSVLINGVRLVMGYDAQIIVDGAYYTLSGYSLTSNGLTFSFMLEKDAGSEEMMKKYHISVIQSYLDSDAYTAQHKAYIKEYIYDTQDIFYEIENNSVEDYLDDYNDTIAELERIKTAAELQLNNTGNVTLKAPVLSKGLGYTVTWTEVEDAKYYVVHDDNDYRETVIVMATEDRVYEAEVVGNHNITVTAHSYYEEYNSATSNMVTTPEVKPVFTYKSMLDGLYKFSSSQMSTMGISTTGCYYDSSDKKYFVYYNKETGCWSPNGADATDWTSPAEFPAHAQRLKDMGNNIILIAYDTNASYKADDTWEASRMRYVMDTAWSMGMKVLVCDEVFYDLSFCDSDHKNTCAQSKAQVTEAINARNGFAEYVTHPAFYGFSLDDEPYVDYMDAMKYTISALDEACEALGVSDPFYLACLFQYQGGGYFELDTKNEVKEYWKDWLNIDGVDNEYLYVDIYTQHAMGQLTDRYNDSFDVVYNDSYLGGKYKFHQAITAHTQNNGVLLEQDLYMSLLYAAAHDVAGYSWFCYFPIAGELAGTLGGYDGNGYGNGIGNNVEKDKCFYDAAKTAGYQFELIQGLLDGYEWKTRSLSNSDNLLTTTLSNGTNTATMYVNADVDDMSSSVTVTASGSQCYLVGYGVGTAEAPYQAVSGSVTLAPGQAVICIS